MRFHQGLITTMAATMVIISMLADFVSVGAEDQNHLRPTNRTSPTTYYAADPLSEDNDMNTKKTDNNFDPSDAFEGTISSKMRTTIGVVMSPRELHNLDGDRGHYEDRDHDEDDEVEDHDDEDEHEDDMDHNKDDDDEDRDNERDDDDDDDEEANQNDKLWLIAHNKRRKHYHENVYGVKYVPLKWSDTLGASAQRYADHLARTDTFKHSDNDVGENLARNRGPSAIPPTPDSVLTRWVENQDEEPGGHFTQVIWRGTRYVGCGEARNKKKNRFVQVCQYVSPGNCNGRSRTNMLANTSPCTPQCPEEGCF